MNECVITLRPFTPYILVEIYSNSINCKTILCKMPIPAVICLQLKLKWLSRGSSLNSTPRQCYRRFQDRLVVETLHYKDFHRLDGDSICPGTAKDHLLSFIYSNIPRCPATDAITWYLRLQYLGCFGLQRCHFFKFQAHQNEIMSK